MKKWLHQLRWKLFISHLIIVLMAYVVLLAASNVLASLGLTGFAPLTLGSAAAETGQLALAAPTRRLSCKSRCSR